MGGIGRKEVVGGSCLLLEQALSVHLGGDIQAHDLQHSGGHIAERSLVVVELVLLARHHKRHTPTGVGGVRGREVVRQHLLGVTVVGSDEQDVVVLHAGLVNRSNGGIRGLNSLDSGLIDSSVSNHIRRGKVAHNKGELASGNLLSNLVSHSLSRHLGLQVICGHLGRRDQIAVLSIELGLSTTVEEESDVGILLSLSNVALGNVLLSQPLGEDVAHGLGRESHGEREVTLVLGHGGDVEILGELDLHGGRSNSQDRRDLAHAIRAVVEAENAVIVANQTLLVNNDGLQELVSDILLVVVLNSLRSIRGEMVRCC